MADTLTIKRGETLSKAASYNLPAGDWNAVSNVKLSDGSRSIVSITPSLLTSLGIATPTYFQIEIDEAITAKFPIGTMKCDVKFSNNSSFTTFSPSFFINVIENETL